MAKDTGEKKEIKNNNTDKKKKNRLNFETHTLDTPGELV